MKFIIWLTDTNRYGGPVVVFNGFTGRHDFIWSEKHRAHIYQGRELSAEEFNSVASDIFFADSGRSTQNYFHAVPKVIEDVFIEPDAEEKIGRAHV